MSGTGVKNLISEQKICLAPLSLRKLQGFQKLCARNWGQRPSIYLLLHHRSTCIRKREEREGRRGKKQQSRARLHQVVSKRVRKKENEEEDEEKEKIQLEARKC